MFDAIADSVACYERDATIVYVNPVTIRMFGRPVEQLLGHNLWTLFPEAVGNAFHEVFLSVAGSDETRHFENFYAPWSRWYHNSVYSVDGRIWVFGRDITEQKQASARLEILAQSSRAFSEAAWDSRALFDTIARQLAEVIHDGCVIRLLSPDGATFEAPAGVWERDPVVLELLREIPAVNAAEGAGGEILRTGRAVMMANVDPRAVADRIAPPDRREFAAGLGIHSVMIVPLKAQGQIVGIVSVIRRRAGSQLPYTQSDLTLLQELADRAALIVSQWRTVRLAEEARERLVLISDSLPVLVALVDREERYRFANATYQTWFGRRPDEIVGKTVQEVVGFAAYEIIRPHISAVLAGEAVSFQSRLPYVSGGARDVHVDYQPYRVNGQVQGYVALVTDITNTVQLESELRAAIALRDDFLSIASHELRTPLTSLVLQLDMLLRSAQRPTEAAVEPRILRKVQDAARQADTLSSLIDALMDVSRINGGRFVIECEPFDLVPFVAEVVRRFDEESARADAPISVRARSSAPVVWDRARMGQALTNLLSNALKYGRPGQVIDVEVRQEGERVAISVRDRGIGIAAGDLTRIFGRFERGVSSSHYGGLGLGLYIAEQIVAAHGGRIDVESKPGDGSVFTMNLPLGARSS